MQNNGIFKEKKLKVQIRVIHPKKKYNIFFGRLYKNTIINIVTQKTK